MSVLLRVFVVLSLVLSFCAHAGVDQSVAWLSTQSSQFDGSVVGDQNIALPIQSTSEAIFALALSGSHGDKIEAARNFVLASNKTGTESLFLKLSSQKQAGGSLSNTLLTIQSHQSNNGAFGTYDDFDGTPLDTAFAIQALFLGDMQSSTEAARAVQFLLSSQGSNGAWQQNGQDELYVTAIVTRALTVYSPGFSAISGALSRAVVFMQSGVTGREGGLEDYLKAQVLLASMPNISDVTVLSELKSSLESAETVNGSWNDDVYTTSLAVRALNTYEQRLVPDATNTGSVSGFVFKEGSREPLGDVEIQVSDLSGVSVTSNSDGYFVISGVNAGRYTLTAAKQGYQTQNIGVDVSRGGVTLAGDVFLNLIADKGILTGVISDASDNAVIVGAQLGLIGDSNYGVITGSAGEFQLSDIESGNYSFMLSKEGYQTVAGTLDISEGQLLNLSYAMLRNGAFADDGPVDLVAHVTNGGTGEVLSNANLVLNGTLSGVSLADGSITVAGVPRGTYQAQLTASGFAEQQYLINVPAGATPDLGVLTLYPENTYPAPTDITVVGVVVNGISGATIADANVISSTGVQVMSAADGSFSLLGISDDEFTLTVQAVDFVDREFDVSVNGVGEVRVTLAISPPGDGTVESTFSGTIVDADSGAAISGAVVRIPSLGLSVNSDALGAYLVPNVTALSFTVEFSAVGYESVQNTVELSEHGEFTFPVQLKAIAPNGVQIVSARSLEPEWQSNETSLTEIEVVNTSGLEISTLLVAEIFNPAGESVGKVLPYLSGTQVSQANFDFQIDESKTLTVPWNTKQFEAASYRMIVRALEPNSISSDNPVGRVLSQATSVLPITQNQKISGVAVADPPLIQAGSQTPVTFSALVKNAGNVVLLQGDYQLIATDAASGQVLHTASASINELGIGKNTTLDFGVWSPDVAGNINVVVKAIDSGIAGQLNTQLYVGDKASGRFTIDRNRVAEGNQIVRGTINLTGLNAASGTSTDPLFPLVRDALENAGDFIGQSSLDWHKSNDCVGCHIQTQSLVGMSAAEGKVNIDSNQVRFLFNTIASTQQESGLLTDNNQPFPRTQGGLGIWALSGVTDREKKARPMLHASEYAYTNLSNSGGRVWRHDHFSDDWWYAAGALTSLYVTGMVDTIEMIRDLDASHFFEYKTEPNGPVDLGRMEHLARDSLGNLYGLSWNGIIRKYDIQTGELSQLPVQLPNESRAIVFDDNDDLYIAVYSGSIVKVDENFNLQTIKSNLGTIESMTINGLGQLAVSLSGTSSVKLMDTQGNDIREITSPLLNRPVGLAYDSAGNLFIANFNGKNILKVDESDEVTVFSDGLAHNPHHLSVDQNGELLVSHWDKSKVLLFTPRGLYRIDRDGFAERIVSNVDPRGFAEVNGDSWFLDAFTGQFVKLLKNPIQDLPARSDKYLAQVLGAVGHFTESPDLQNANDFAVRATKTLALAKARRVIQDASTLALIDSAIADEVTFMRSVQHADGGWGRRTSLTASDPLVTALVGLAIDTTSPSAEDPVVRNIVTYLLNTQTANGSWRNVNSGTTTNLGGTSLIMTYLPALLDRVGSIDVDLNLEFPQNAVPNNFTVQPTESMANASGGIDYRWAFQGVTAAGRSVGFDLNLADMQLNEVRDVADRAYLEFANSFTDESEQLDLDIPQVTSNSNLQLSRIVTDKTVYTANEAVNISVDAINVGPLPASGTLTLTIVGAENDSLLVELPAQSISDLAPNGVLTLNDAWNTQATLPSAFTITAQLRDAQNRILSELSSNFVIEATPEPAAIAKVQTDKAVYLGWDNVEITGRVINNSANAIFPEAIVTITVTNSADQVVFEQSQNTFEMGLNAQLDRLFNQELADAVAGLYTVQMDLLDGFSRSLIGSDSTSFEVQRSVLTDLIGDVSVEAPTVLQGDTNVCTQITRNRASAVQNGLQLSHQLVNVQTNEVIDTVNETVTLNGAQTSTYQRSIDTTALEPGEYACVLSANIEGVVSTLGGSLFLVEESLNNIDIDLAATSGDTGRVLVLLDNSTHCTDDPHGPRNTPDLATQQAYLENVLSNAGWSYTITLNDTDFVRELRTGGYSNYFLLAEVERLSHFAQKELREAVYRGEGLIEAGKRLQPHEVVNSALGIQHRGQERRAQGIELLDGDLGSANSILFSHRDANTRATPRGAQLMAEYMNGQSSNSNHYADQQSQGSSHAKRHYWHWRPPVPRTTPAITLNEFGLGKAIFMGFDLLSEASTLGGDTNAFSELLLNALVTVNPKPPLTTIGTDYPIVFTVSNLANATPVTLVLPIPENVSIVDAGDGVVNAESQSISWSLDLAQAQQKEIRVWVEMPTVSTTLNASVVTGEAPNGIEQATASIELTPETAMSIDDVIESASQARALKKVKHSLKYARWYQNKGRTEHALRSLLIAANHVAHIQKYYESENLTALRVNIGLLIRQTAMQVVVEDRHHRCIVRGSWGNYHYPRYPKSCRHKHWNRYHLKKHGHTFGAHNELNHHQAQESEVK